MFPVWDAAVGTQRTGTKKARCPDSKPSRVVYPHESGRDTPARCLRLEGASGIVVPPFDSTPDVSLAGYRQEACVSLASVSRFAHRAD